jgi:chromosome segregation ATPase
MIADTRYEELERRLLTAESDIVGDRHVSQYAAEQARRGTEAFLALRAEVNALRVDIAATTARVDALAENVAAINAMLVRHGRAIEVLQQDVREMRNEMATRQEIAAVREEVATVREEIAAVREEAAIQHAELLTAIRTLGSGAHPG